jgi:hypothetical protein
LFDADTNVDIVPIYGIHVAYVTERCLDWSVRVQYCRYTPSSEARNLPELRDQPDCFLSIDSMFTNILQIRSQREPFEFPLNPASDLRCLQRWHRFGCLTVYIDHRPPTCQCRFGPLDTIHRLLQASVDIYKHAASWHIQPHSSGMHVCGSL